MSNAVADKWRNFEPVDFRTEVSVRGVATLVAMGEDLLDEVDCLQAIVDADHPIAEAARAYVRALQAFGGTRSIEEDDLDGERFDLALDALEKACREESNEQQGRG